MMCLEALELEVPASVPAVPTRSAAVARISRCRQALRGAPRGAAVVGRRTERRRGTNNWALKKLRLGGSSARRRRATPTVPFVGSRRNLRIAARRLPVADCSPLSTPSSTRFFEGLLP
jgi:hypothetical protein